LGLCAADSAIAAAAHFARDDGGAQCVLGAPVGGIERRIEEEAEDGLEFGPQMRREAAGIGESAGSRRDQLIEAVDVVAARHREAMVRDLPGALPSPRGERGLQQGLHARRKRMIRMVEHHRATAAEQMRETGLMRGVDELPVGRPAVALQHTGIVGAEHPRRLGKTAPVFDRVGRGVRCRKRPQPVRMATNLPAGFIGRNDGTAAHLRAQRVIGRLGLARRAMDRVDQPAARDGEAEAIAQQLHDAAEGKAALFVEDHRQRHRLWPELHRRRAQRVRRLPRMPPLDPAAALRAVAHRDAKLVDDRPLHGEIFLKLRDDTAAPDRAAAVGTPCGQRRVVRHVNARRRTPVRRPAVGGARLAPGAIGILLGQPTRERRGLAIGSATRHLELFFQPFVFAAQTIALDLRAPHVLAESLVFTPQLLDDLLGITRWRRIRWAPRHDMLMPDSRAQYKREMRISGELTR